MLYVLIIKRLLHSYLYGLYETKISTDVCTMNVYHRGSNKVAAETSEFLVDANRRDSNSPVTTYN